MSSSNIKCLLLTNGGKYLMVTDKGAATLTGDTESISKQIISVSQGAKMIQVIHGVKTFTGEKLSGQSAELVTLPANARIMRITAAPTYLPGWVDGQDSSFDASIGVDSAHDLLGQSTSLDANIAGLLWHKEAAAYGLNLYFNSDSHQLAQRALEYWVEYVQE